LIKHTEKTLFASYTQSNVLHFLKLIMIFIRWC